MSVRTLQVKLPVPANEDKLYALAKKTLGGKMGYFSIRKKSLDARDKNRLLWVYTIEFSREEQPKRAPLARLAKNKLPEKPVLIVGSGPAGLFAAIRLIDRGIVPVLVERGPAVEEREKKINAFSLGGVLDENGNVQFGEGGAGTFSDGKLNTQTHSGLNSEVLETFVRFGAPEEILYLNKPHIGSDNLKKVIVNMRSFLLAAGVSVRFNTCLTDLTTQGGRVKSVTLKDFKTGREEILEPSAVVLAIGHSARDTFERLLSRGVKMTRKDFAVGLRIEHKQAAIGRAQYGESYTLLPAADYKLVSHAGERAAFTFCMCPGGFVMPAASETGGVVVNGMSNYARDGENANSALIAQVKAEDFGGEHPLAGVEFQRELERAAYEAGGGGYAAPTQLVKDFLVGRVSEKYGEISPTYPVGTAFADLNAILPKTVRESLKAAILDMDRRLKGFACPEAVLTGVESRTSAPVRIERDETLQSVSCEGLYPCGEGAGYAGGITSSAADGLRVAEKIFEAFS
ncbi:MAG: FAD-dependent monooxygenase [Clostridia bacterium]|nr:FAD-dependent monooxygenase [Clostridia bacterium]